MALTFTVRTIDGLLRFDTTNDDIVVTLLPFAQTPNAPYHIQRISTGDGHTLTIQVDPNGSDFLLPDGTKSIVLNDGTYWAYIKIPDSGASPAYVTSGGAGGAGVPPGTPGQVPIYSDDGSTLIGSVIYQGTDGNVGIGAGYSATAAPVNQLDVGFTAGTQPDGSDNIGGIHITPGVPGNTTDALYDDAGQLMWAGKPVGTGLTDVYQDLASGNIGIGPEFNATNLPVAPLQVGDNGDAPLTGGFEQVVMSSGQGILSQTNDANSWALVGYNSATGSEVDIAGPGAAIQVKSGGVIVNGAAPPHNSLDVDDGGGIYIADSPAGMPVNTANALYSENGQLYFNGAPVSGVAGTPGYIPVFSTATALDDSVMFQSGANVGIGTTTPGAPLEIHSGGNSFIGITGTGYSTIYLLAGASGGVSNIAFDNMFQIGTAGSLGTAVTPLVTILSTGNVGIGTMSPAAQLQIGTVMGLFDANGQGFPTFANNLYTDGTDWRYLTAAPGSAIEQTPQGGITFYTVLTGTAGAVAPVVASPRMVLTNTGLVGINQDNPRGLLDVTSTDSTTDILVIGTGTVAYPTAQNRGYAVFKASLTDARIGVQDGYGRFNVKWNWYVDSGGQKFIVSNEPALWESLAVMGDLTHGAWEFEAALPGTAGAAPAFTRLAHIGNDTIWLSIRGVANDFAVNADGSITMAAGPGIQLLSGTPPSSTTSMLYNQGGTLMWNGAALATGSSISGTPPYIPYFTASDSLSDSVMWQDGNSDINIGVPLTGMVYKLNVCGPSAGSATGILRLITPGAAQGEQPSVSFFATFQGTGDSGPRRAADVFAGYNAGAWGAEYLSFGVGTGGANDPAAVTTERMRIQGNGFVGINHTAPPCQLTVNASAGWNAPANSISPALLLAGLYGGGLAMQDGTGFIGIWSSNTGGLMNFGVGGTSGGFPLGFGQMVLDGNNLGIGTNTPAYRLHVEQGRALVNAGSNVAQLYRDVMIGGVNGWVDTETHSISFIYGSAATPSWLSSIQASYTGSIARMAFVNEISNATPVLYLLGGSQIGIATTTPVTTLDIGIGGGIHITDGAPATVTNCLYSSSGALYWNGAPLATGSSISGSPNYIPVFTAANSLGDSIMWQRGSNNILIGNSGISQSGSTHALVVIGPTAGNATGTVRLNTPGAQQGESPSLSFYGTFQGSSDNGPRRIADIFAGFMGTWTTEYLSICVGNGTTNDAGNLTNERMRILGNGFVGIGCVPSYTLEVNGQALVEGTNCMYLFSDRTDGTTWGLYGTSSRARIWNATNGDVCWWDEGGNFAVYQSLISDPSAKGDPIASLRMIPPQNGGVYTSMFRNDGNATFILFTGANDNYGTFNALRPFTMQNATGALQLSGNTTQNDTGKVTDALGYDLTVISGNNRVGDGGIIAIGGSFGPTACIKSEAENGSAGNLVFAVRGITSGNPNNYMTIAMRIGWNGAVWMRDAIPTTVQFGCAGDGVTDDKQAIQNAIASIAGVTPPGCTGMLRIPAGCNHYLSNYISIPSNFFIIGDGPLSKITGAASGGHASVSSGYGLIDFPAGVTNAGLANLYIEGSNTTPVAVLWNSAAGSGGSPDDAVWTNGSSVWIHDGCGKISIRNVTINHTGGYAVYWHAEGTPISDIDINDCRITNSRAGVMGQNTGDTDYLGWNGGIFGSNNNLNTWFENVRVVAQFVNCTGHCFWTRATNLGAGLGNMNRNVSVRIKAHIHLGDATEPGDIDGYYEDVESTLCGFICATAPTGFTTGALIDYAPTLTSSSIQPKWVNTGGVNVPAVVADTTGLLLNASRRVIADGFNGLFCSGDGMGKSVVTGSGTSAFKSTNPLIRTNLCGPGSNGVNSTAGVVLSNSSGQAQCGDTLITGVTLRGVGFQGIGVYGQSQCAITGCLIDMDVLSGQSSPIALGSVNIGGTLWYANRTKVTGNNVIWASGSGYAVAEDAQYTSGSYPASAQNMVDSSNSYNCGGLFFKMPTTSSTTGAIRLSSVTAPSGGNLTPDIRATILQTEGGNGGGSDYAFKGYWQYGSSSGWLFQAQANVLAVPGVFQSQGAGYYVANAADTQSWQIITGLPSGQANNPNNYPSIGNIYALTVGAGGINSAGTVVASAVACTTFTCNGNAYAAQFTALVLTQGGIMSYAGIQATGYNIGTSNGTVTAYGANINIGIFMSGGQAYFYNRAQGTQYLYNQITVQGGVITGLG